MAKNGYLTRTLQHSNEENEEANQRVNLLEKKHRQEIDDVEYRSALAKEQDRESEEKIRLLEEKVVLSEEKVCMLEEQDCEANEKEAHLEWELPHKVVKDFKDSVTFGVAAEDFLATKIIELYETLATQIKGVDLNFPLDKVEAFSELLLWKKDKEAPPPEGEEYHLRVVLTTFLITSLTPNH